MIRTHAFRCFLMGAFLLSAGCAATPKHPTSVVVNPYTTVDWDNHSRHHGNFHTHTTESDGKQDPADVIDGYHALGHDVLAITDHDKVTWPWSKFGRDPQKLGMVAVQGNELSSHHHTLSLFTGIDVKTRDLIASLKAIEAQDGVGVLAHPGRYWKLKDGKVPDEVRDRYVDHYTTYKTLVAMEVVNQGDRYPQDRALWDAVLTKLMPARPVWGMANDDSHNKSHIGLNTTVLLLPEHTDKAVRAALESGAYYFTTVTSHPKDQRDPAGVPVIHRIEHDQQANTITIAADCLNKPLPDDAYRWITADGKEVSKGPALSLNETEGLGGYVRVEIRGTGGTAYTQPFGLEHAEQAATSEPREAFRFAHVCDTQLGMGGYEHDLATFEQAVAQINALGVDFVVICGDLVGRPNEKSINDFNRIRAKFEMPCHVVPGNHDVGNEPTEASLQSYREVIGKDTFMFEHKGYAFIGVNTSLWKAPVAGESQKHDAWLDRSLDQAAEQGTPTFILGHYPLFIKQADEPEGYYNLPFKTRHELLNKFAASGVVAVLTGHAHRIIINEYAGMQLVTGQATSKTHGSPLGFRLWHIQGEPPFKHESIDLEP